VFVVYEVEDSFRILKFISVLYYLQESMKSLHSWIANLQTMCHSEQTRTSCY